MLALSKTMTPNSKNKRKWKKKEGLAQMEELSK
jgi:hypothetical protein